MMLNINTNNSISLTNAVVSSAAQIIILSHTLKEELSAKKRIINKANTAEELGP